MTADELGFLTAILADPADDTVRLVYADWLQEQGREERAEFIRVQCELAMREMPVSVQGNLQLFDHGDDYDTLRRREGELLTNSCGVWFAWQGCPGSRAEFTNPVLYKQREERAKFDALYRRGFAHSITCSAEDWLKHADALAWHPTQTMECPMCNGTKHTEFYPCRQCWMDAGNERPTGRIPRPCPSTAQPIREVTITDRHSFLSDHGVANDHSKGFTDDRWPGITFNLPT